MYKNNLTVKESSPIKTLEQIREIEKFLHTLSDKIGNRKLKNGANLSAFLKKNKMTVPVIFDTDKAVYHEYNSQTENSKRKIVIVTKPDKNYQEVMARKIFCIRTRWGTACLECGWIWCRIVIYY